ncbi:MAG: hypothetical protein ACKVQT_15305 [Burkholderiales bacterium]
MMTTIDLSDDLLQRAKRLARREGLTLRALIEEGLRLALKSRERRTALPFRVRPFRGDGFTAEYRDAGWEMIRGEIYRGPD